MEAVIEKGKVSVIISSFNRPTFLSEAIQSVQQQSYQNLEILICDDASTDPMVETTAMRHMAIDRRVQFLRMDVNRGLRASRQFGVRASTGEYIQFLDDDDQLHPRKLEIQVDALDSNSDFDMAGCQTLHFTRRFGDSDLVWNLFGENPNVRDRFLKHNHLWGTEGPLWRRSVLDRLGGYGSRPDREVGANVRGFVLEDYEHAAVLFLRGLQALPLRYILAFHRETKAGNLSVVKDEKRALSHFRVFQLMAAEFDRPDGATNEEAEAMSDNFVWSAWLLMNAECVEEAGRALKEAVAWCRNDSDRTNLEKLDARDAATFEQFFASVRDPRTDRDGWWRKYRLSSEPAEPLPPRKRR